jgi:hypothetical protein
LSFVLHPGEGCINGVVLFADMKKEERKREKE